MSKAITTRSFDNARTGAYLHEEVLTPAAVGTRGIRRAFSLNMTGDRRGIEAQPLAVPNVQIGDGSRHDVIYLADMANQVWAFDAATGVRLWMRSLGPAVNGGKAIDSWVINDHWGVLSTPVIDTHTGALYAVAWTSADASVAAARHVCFAVSLRDGQDIHPPVDLEGAVYDAGHGTPVQQFRSATRKQRAALLLTKVNGIATVFIAFGSVNETSKDARGWVIACGTEPFAMTAAWSAAAVGFGGGIWHGAGGLAADGAGLIYAMTGNGTFDGVTDFSESFVKLRYTPPAGAAAKLELIDWWTPYTDKARTAAHAPASVNDIVSREIPADETASPTNFRAYVEAPAPEAMDPADWGDMDLASGGPVVVTSHECVLGSGKDGVLYVLDQNDMGKTSPADLVHPAGNYAKLRSQPIFFTYYTPDVSPAPDDIRDLNLFAAGVTHHLHGNPVYWNSPDRGPLVFCWGENGNLRAWSLEQNATLQYLARSAETASPQTPVPYGGMPGGMISVSAREGVPGTGIVWACVPYGDGNKTVTGGRLLAYDAATYGTFEDGSGQLRMLWDSQDWNLPFSFNKFNRPIVFNDRVYVPTYDDRVDVYELA